MLSYFVNFLVEKTTTITAKQQLFWKSERVLKFYAFPTKTSHPQNDTVPFYVFFLYLRFWNYFGKMCIAFPFH